MHTSLSSASVFWRTLVGYPSYARNRACALPSPSPFHQMMAKIVTVVQLAAHAKSSTLYSRSYGVKSKFFLDGLILFRIIMDLRRARCELCYYCYYYYYYYYYCCCCCHCYHHEEEKQTGRFSIYITLKSCLEYVCRICIFGSIFN